MRRFEDNESSRDNKDNNKGAKAMNDADDILETVGYAIQEYFGSVESVPGAVYITKNGKTYCLSIMECEEAEEV